MAEKCLGPDLHSARKCRIALEWFEADENTYPQSNPAIVSRPHMAALPYPLTEIAPCDGCKFRERCARDLLACARFCGYVHGEPQHRWALFSCAPNRARYEALLGPEAREHRPMGRPRKHAAEAA